jgi:integral membrane sensor domain MASE1
LLPIFAVAEIMVSSTSHNLWPLEFAIYGFVSLSAIVGAFLGRLIQRRLSHAKV